MISRHNVDSLSSTSWGHHENYLIHNHRKQKYAEILIPHLVTRTIYTGSGGLNIDFDKKTCQFVISPKASFLTSLIDHGSQYNRPLFHLKNEPLCRKYRRLHLICGENLYSELSRFLMVATTALLIILTDHQKTMPVCGTLLDEPLKCMQDISMDIGLKKKVKSKTSKYKRPLDIQWQYLEYVYSNIDQPFMPAWARFTCELWKKTLQKLEKGRASVSAELDWAIKLEFLEKKINEWGYSFFKQSSPLELAEEQLYELLQLELSFSQLGSQGLFRTLDNNGVLKHHVVGMPSICKEKMHQPPVMGRAAIRATAINRLSKQTEDHYLADWDKVVSYDGSKVLDLKAVERSNEDWSVRKTSIPSQLIEALKNV